jgi:hypothetical protein
MRKLYLPYRILRLHLLLFKISRANLFFCEENFLAVVSLVCLRICLLPFVCSSSPFFQPKTNKQARNGSPLANELLGEPKDFVVGFLMGFFLGIIMLFWVWERGPYRQKLGIMCGVSCQLLLRFLKRDSEDRLGVVPSSSSSHGGLAAAAANGHLGHITGANNTTTATGAALLGNYTDGTSGEAAAAAAGAALERAAVGGGSGGSAVNGSDHYEDFFSIMGR